jgi:mannonate dehydratase
MSNIHIKDVKTILTAPAGINLVVVKIETSEPGLYGLGCATFTQRHLAVRTAVDEYIRPFLIGKDPSRIEDIWQTAMVSGYWRNGPIMNNAVSGADMALWDIKGKLAGMPVYELLGGKCREAVAVYRHADGRDEREVEENIRKFMDEGYRHVRAQMGLYGGHHERLLIPEGALPGAYYDPAAYARSIPKLFEHLRSALGPEIELLHDVRSIGEGPGAVPALLPGGCIAA